MNTVKLKKYQSASVRLLVVFVVVFCTSVEAVTNSIGTSTAWNTPGAWSEGHIPTGTEDASILSDVTITQSGGISASNYTGNLIINSGATLSIACSASVSILDYFPSAISGKIYMNSDSKIYMNGSTGVDPTWTNPIVLAGAVTYQQHYNMADNNIISSVISGTGSLTYNLNPWNNESGRLTYLTPLASNTYSGGTTFYSQDGRTLYVTANGAFGTGDLTINKGVVDYSGSVSDAIADAAELWIDSTGKLDLNANNETVRLYVLDGVVQNPSGYPTTWGSTSSGATNQDNAHFLGNGVLTVTGDPDVTPPRPTTMTFAILPAGSSVTSIVMTATTARDVDTVQYLFTNVTTAATSGWQTSTVYDETGLTPGATYEYRVRARDVTGNETEWSDSFSTTPSVYNNLLASGDWNTPGSWSLGHVPTGTESVVITENNTVTVSATPTATYTGDLMIESNATLNKTANTVSIGACTPAAPYTGRVLLYDGALIQCGTFWSSGPVTMPNPFVLSGNSTFKNTTYNTKLYLSGIWSGTGSITFTPYTYQAADSFHFTGSSPNTYSGGTILEDASVGDWEELHAEANGCFGTGDVNVNAGRGVLLLDGTTTDTIDDGASLSLTNGSKLQLNANNETINKLFALGIAWPAGTYSSIGTGGVSNEISAISGSGVLTVLSDATNDVINPTVTFAAVAPYGTVWPEEPFSATITFDEPHRPALTAGDLENTEAAGIEILSITPNSLGAENLSYTVLLKATSSGLVNLGIKSSVTINDLYGNALVHPAADDDTITISADDMPSLSGELKIFKIWSNGRINPATGAQWAHGDQYRLMFVTTGTTNANSTDINYYNSFVQSIAEGSTEFPLLGNATWKVVGSTETVDARDNTGTNPDADGPGLGIFLLDGFTKIADNNTDLWDNSLDNMPSMDENGAQQTHGDVATGTTKNLTPGGTKNLTQYLGALSKICYGRCTETGGSWIEVYNGTAANPYPYYAISEPLTLRLPAGTMIMVK